MGAIQFVREYGEHASAISHTEAFSKSDFPDLLIKWVTSQTGIDEKSNGYWSFKIRGLESLIETFLNCTQLQFACQGLTMSFPHLTQLTIIPSLTSEMWQLGRIKLLKIRRCFIRCTIHFQCLLA